MLSKVWPIYYFFVLLLLMFGVESKVSVIVIGAGASGIATASKLLENGFENVLVLEAEDRIGGRVHTVQFKDDIVELGAEHCHGEKDNVVFKLVRRYNVLEPVDVENTIFHSTYKQLDPRFCAKLYKLYDTLYSDENVSTGSLGEQILSRYNSTVLKLFKNKHEQNLAVDGQNLVEKWVLCNDGTFSWFDSSADCEYELCEGNQELTWKKNGFKTILEVLMKTFPKISGDYPLKNKIHLNKEVNKIDWSSDNKIVVKCSDKTEFAADHVVVTVSLGVLKARHRDMFHPPLPKQKIKAIRHLGIAAVSKIFVYFPEKWWSDNDEDFTMMWSSADITNSGREFPEGPQKGNVSWITNLISFHEVRRNPNVLLAWFVGEFVPEIELCNSETVVNGLMFALNKFIGYKYANITRPTELKRFNWYTNSHFHGSYSFETVNSRKFRIAQDWLLAEPIKKIGKPKLLFAGEATNSRHYATVHGAVESGFREAHRIIKFYNTTSCS